MCLMLQTVADYIPLYSKRKIYLFRSFYAGLNYASDEKITAIRPGVKRAYKVLTIRYTFFRPIVTREKG